MNRILSALALVFLITSAGKAQIVNFKNHHYFNSVPYPDQVEAADVNNDGITDIVAIGQYGVHVLLNHINGSSDLTTYASPGLWQIAVGDFDGDEYVDIATIGFDSLYVLRNSGSGTFTMSGVLLYSPAIGRLTSADFNKDGKDDLAVGTPFGENVLVFISHGDAVEKLFNPPTSYTVSTSSNIDHGDFNVDGFDDLVVLDGDHASFSILINNGDGTFAAPQQYQTASYPSSLALADLNGDDKVDLIVGTAGETPVIEIHENTGGMFVLQKSYATGLEFVTPQYLCAADLDDDDRADVAFIDWSAGILNAMTNEGGWQFDLTLKLPLGGQPRALISGDFNADEKPDLAIGNYSSIQIAYNEGGLSFDIVAHGAGYPTSMAHGDFNNDGTPDIVTTNFNDSSVSVMLNDGHGQFNSQVHYITGVQPNTVIVGDVVGDTNLDLIVANVQEDSIALLKGSGNGTFTLQKKYLVGDSPIGIALADYDGDGTRDIMVLASPLTLLLNSPGGFSEPITIAGFDGPRALTSGDVNGDTLPDLVVCTYGFRPGLYLFINNGSGTFGNPTSLTEFGEVGTALVSDFTFDNIPDIGYTYDGHLHVLVNDGVGHFTHRLFQNNLYDARHIIKGDFTGDGKDDVAVGSISSAAFSVLVADDNKGYHEPVTFKYKGYLLSMTSANMDGDDKDDIAVGGWPYHYLSIGISLPRFDIFVHDTTRYYGDPNPEFESTIVDWQGPGELEVDYKTAATESSWIGNYEVTPVVSDSVSENFAVVKHPGVLTIAPAPLIITALDTARLVGMPNPYFTYTITGLRNNDEYPVYLYCDAQPESPVGKYRIIPQPSYGGNPNYAPTFIEGILTVMSESAGEPYPNPSDGEFIVYSLVSTTYEIVDRTGRTMQSGSIVPTYNHFVLEARPGIYFIYFGNGVVHKIAMR